MHYSDDANYVLSFYVFPPLKYKTCFKFFSEFFSFSFSFFFHDGDKAGGNGRDK